MDWAEWTGTGFGQAMLAKGVIAEKRAFYRGSTGLHGCAVVLGRMGWAEGLKTRFSVLGAVMMGRIDWLRGADTAFGKAVLAIALEFGVFFDEKWWMVRLDWAKGGERNGWEG